MHFRLYSLKAELANGDACASDLLRERSQKKLQGSESVSKIRQEKESIKNVFSAGV